MYHLVLRREVCAGKQAWKSSTSCQEAVKQELEWKIQDSFPSQKTKQKILSAKSASLSEKWHSNSGKP